MAKTEEPEPKDAAEAATRARKRLYEIARALATKSLSPYQIARGLRIEEASGKSFITDELELLEETETQGSDGQRIHTQILRSRTLPLEYHVVDDPLRPALDTECFLVDPDSGAALEPLFKSVAPRGLEIDAVPPDPGPTHVFKYNLGARIPAAMVLPPEAKDRLLDTLQRADSAATDFVERIGACVSFAVDVIVLTNRVKPLATERTSLDKARQYAELLRAQIQDLGPAGDWLLFRSAVNDNLQDPEALWDTIQRLPALLRGALDYIPPLRGGAPERFATPALIYAMAAEYVDKLGEPPTAARRGPFYRVVDTLLTGVLGSQIVDPYYDIKKALSLKGIPIYGFDLQIAQPSLARLWTGYDRKPKSSFYNF